MPPKKASTKRSREEAENTAASASPSAAPSSPAVAASLATTTTSTADAANTAAAASATTPTTTAATTDAPPKGPMVYAFRIALNGVSKLWRRFEVVIDPKKPATFATLHDIAQTVMGWCDCHMHEFNVKGLGRVMAASHIMGGGVYKNVTREALKRLKEAEVAGSLPPAAPRTLGEAMDALAKSYEEREKRGETISAAEKKRAMTAILNMNLSHDSMAAIEEEKLPLSAVFKMVGDKCFYMYDFGDGWEHTITLNKITAVVPNVRYPRCVSGKGACPPEDCGGIYGFKDLKEAIANPTHPEHDAYLEHAGEDHDPDAFDLEEVNTHLAATHL